MFLYTIMYKPRVTVPSANVILLYLIYNYYSLFTDNTTINSQLALLIGNL